MIRGGIRRLLETTMLPRRATGACLRCQLHIPWITRPRDKYFMMIMTKPWAGLMDAWMEGRVIEKDTIDAGSIRSAGNVSKEKSFVTQIAQLFNVFAMWLERRAVFKGKRAAT
jgi:hypothetical protein